MARNWFQHDYNAKNDDKVLELRAEYGWKGYGLFYAFIETMCENETGSIDTDRIGGLSIAYNLPKDELLTFIDFCIKIDLFYRDEDGLLRNERVTNHVEKMKSYSEAGKKGAKKRWSKDSNRGANEDANRGANEDPNADKIREDNTIQDNTKKTLLFDLESNHFDLDGTVEEKIDWTTVRLHEILRDRIGHYKSMKKATLESWRDHVRLMYEEDDLSFEEIWGYLKFAMQDDFWKDVVKSTSGLRNNWEEIDQSIRRRKTKGNNGKRRPSTDGFDKEKASHDLSGLSFD